APPVPRSRMASAVACASAILALLVYARTAYRTISWWDGSSYPLAACTLGIPPAPGSLLLTLLGFAVHAIPVVDPVAFRLNLFAGLMAAVTVGLVTLTAIRLSPPEGRAPSAVECFAGLFAGLVIAFGPSLWSYAVQFTPYVLSACFTALILVVAL